MSSRPLLVCGVGDNVVDRYLDTGLEYPGGNAYNVAVFARRAGAAAAYLGIVGADASGDHLVNVLRREDVDVSRVRRVPGPNSYAVVHLTPGGNREFAAWEPIPDRLTLEPEDRELVVRADLVHTGHASFTESLVPSLAELALVSFDFSYRGLDYAEPLLPHLWSATFSGAGLTAGQARELATTAQGRGPKVVLVTRGAQGAVVAVDGVLHEEPAAPADVVDTLGAGDAFAARFLIGLLRGEEAKEAAAAAAGFAARVCESFGAFGHARSMVTSTSETADPNTDARGEQR
ncbi:PfkB family carbohydrate kinase [Micromonospora sp. NPDC048830]|uniref:PfkB family carbohydrate kinase n=1 Tax=Micromonospora sp. NPDC048830 TaxID=3364257 RepID=UPI003715B6BB